MHLAMAWIFQDLISTGTALGTYLVTAGKLLLVPSLVGVGIGEAAQHSLRGTHSWASTLVHYAVGGALVAGAAIIVGILF